MSYYELLAKVQYVIQELCAFAHELDDDNKELRAAIDSLTEEFEKFKESGFDDYYADQIERWVNDNLGFIFERYTRGIYFGLTLDGHFVAYIPESWSDVIFDTGMDYSLDTYGRLILRMDVDSPYDNVDQTPEVVRPYTDEELEIKVRNIMNTLYAIGGGNG